MEIVWLILKIIGTTLLVLLGLILSVVLLIVFFPISYRISASYDEKIEAKAKVHWLFHLISVTLNYKDDVKTCILRVLGIPITDFLNPKPKKEKKKPKQKEKQEEAISVPAAKDLEQTVTLEDFTKESLEADNTDEDIRDIDNIEADTQEMKQSLLEKIKGFFTKIRGKIEAIIQKIRDIFQKGVDIKAKIDYYVEILSRERTKLALSKAKDELIGVLKHIMPRKWNAYVEMGFDDPATTGQILGYYWMFIGLWGNHFICVPDFEHKVLKANVDAKGHIQVCKFIYVLLKFLFDKDLVYLRKTIMQKNS